MTSSKTVRIAGDCVEIRFESFAVGDKDYARIMVTVSDPDEPQKGRWESIFLDAEMMAEILDSMGLKIVAGKQERSVRQLINAAANETTLDAVKRLKNEAESARYWERESTARDAEIQMLRESLRKQVDYTNKLEDEKCQG